MHKLKPVHLTSDAIDLFKLLIIQFGLNLITYDEIREHRKEWVCPHWVYRDDQKLIDELLENGLIVDCDDGYYSIEYLLFATEQIMAELYPDYKIPKMIRAEQMFKSAENPWGWEIDKKRMVANA